MAYRVFLGVRDGIAVGFGGATTDWNWFDAVCDTVEEANDRHATEVSYSQMNAGMDLREAH